LPRWVDERARKTVDRVVSDTDDSNSETGDTKPRRFRGLAIFGAGVAQSGTECCERIGRGRPVSRGGEFRSGKF